jgi:hypothetical protein
MEGNMQQLETRNAQLRLSIVLGALAMTLATPVTAQAQDEDRFEGAYMFVGGAKQRQQREASIDSTVSQLNAIIRPFALRAFNKTTAVPSRIVFSRQGELLAIALVPMPPRPSRVDGTPSEFVTVNGSTATLMRRHQGDRILETMSQRRGSRIITYRLRPGGDVLDTSWRVEAPGVLETPLEFRLTYRRVGAGPQ